MKECLRQLDEYFKGKRKKFSVPLLLDGTDFQKAVWRQLQRIPCGQTASYGDVARAIGSPQAFRAVGNANNKNPIPLIIPCHRVIGSDGKLVGFGSGIWRKEWLLDHEKSFRQ
jgi:methylated-DNA-[protein]-cysteine S-methyltransferase